MTEITAKIAAQYYSETTMLHDEERRYVVQIHTSSTPYVYCPPTSAAAAISTHVRLGRRVPRHPGARTEGTIAYTNYCPILVALSAMYESKKRRTKSALAEDHLETL